MMKPNRKRKLGSRSGQVMVEACVALALLIFTWILIAVSTFMGTNQVRATMAARHAAWLKGNQSKITTEALQTNIRDGFFYQGDMAKVEFIEPVSAWDAITGNEKLDKVLGDGKGPFRPVVSFGIETNELETTGEFPFTLMKTDLPFMPSPFMGEFLKVEAACQWDEVGDAWDGKSWDVVIRIIGDIGETIKGMF